MSSTVPTLRRVLFVDDDAAILSGLARVLRPLRHEIQSEFATSGAEALARLAQERFDVVVTDMRMPVMDGSALLEEIHRLHPHLIRIALSGHADLQVAMRAVPVAHQFLAKPCDAKTLRAVIRRAALLQDLLNDRDLQALAAGMRELPTRPKTFAVLSERLSDPSTKSSDIAEVIARDVGMAANLLKIVNSAFFGLPRRVSSIEAAVNYLGTNMLRAIVVANAAAIELGPRASRRGYDLDLSEAHALLSANLAMQLFTDRLAREDAFMAGLLQNIGELLLVAEGPDSALAAMELARSRGCSLYAAERELAVVSHAHVGAYLLGAWGLPPGIVEAVAYHHEPGALAHDGLELVDAVHAAGSVADHYVFGAPDGLELAAAHLAALHCPERMDELRVAAERLHGRARSGRAP